MPPKKVDRESEAVAAEDAAAAKLSRALFDEAVDSRMMSRVRPSSLKERVPSKLLRKSDCKDIHKKSSVKKNRYVRRTFGISQFFCLFVARPAHSPPPPLLPPPPPLNHPLSKSHDATPRTIC